MRTLLTLTLSSLALPCLAQSGEVVAYGSTSSILCASLGFFTVIVGGLVFLGAETRALGAVRVVAPPPGDEPEELRRAWVGIELPLRKHLSGSDNDGYCVSGADALRLLAAHNPVAAHWWHTRLHHGSVVVFPTDTCLLVEAPQSTQSRLSPTRLSQPAES